jgi:hypothetical protein
VLSGHLPKSASATPRTLAVSPGVDEDVEAAQPEPHPRPTVERSRAVHDEPEIAHEPTPVEDVPAAVQVDAYEDEPEYAPETPATPPVTIVDEPPSEQVAEALPEPSPADEPEPGGEMPVARAGQDQAAWIGWNELTLDGRASEGANLAYRWEQTAGPFELRIANPDRPLTKATGLPVGENMEWLPSLYGFELTVTDAQGREAVDAVQFVVLPAPELTITPKAETWFELRDGYYLAYFEAWQTNTDSYETAFRIRTPTALTFTKTTGDEYELTSERKGENHVYYVSLFHDVGQDVSWVELLVDTEEGVPGIVQLGVNWEVGYARKDSKAKRKEAVQ